MKSKLSDTIHSISKKTRPEQYGLLNNLNAINSEVYASREEAEGIAKALVKSKMVRGSVQVVKLISTISLKNTSEFKYEIELKEE